MADEVRDPIKGEGYAAAHLDGMGEGYGFRKVRRVLDVTAFGINAIVLPTGIETGFHYHDVQEETYFVHRGRLEFEFGDGRNLVLGPGGFVRVDASTHRKVRNVGDEDAVYPSSGARTATSGARPTCP